MKISKNQKKSTKGFGSKTLCDRANRTGKNGILHKWAFSEIQPRVECQLTTNGPELKESVIDLLQWLIKRSSKQMIYSSFNNI
jgi:DNA-binding HxlR family transcriptional regulator